MILDEKLYNLIYAIENLIEDMEFRRNPGGSYSGQEGMAFTREELKKALRECLDQSQNG